MIGVLSGPQRLVYPPLYQVTLPIRRQMLFQYNHECFPATTTNRPYLKPRIVPARLVERTSVNIRPHIHLHQSLQSSTNMHGMLLLITIENQNIVEMPKAEGVLKCRRIEDGLDSFGSGDDVDACKDCGVFEVGCGLDWSLVEDADTGVLGVHRGCGSTAGSDGLRVSDG